MGYGNPSPNGRMGGLTDPDTFRFILKARCGTIARVSGAYWGLEPLGPGRPS